MSGPFPIGVGMPAWLALQEFGMILRDDFQCIAYLVGSALERKNPRDIDVRVQLYDDEFVARFPPGAGGSSPTNVSGTRWAAQCRAYSALGREMTGLPIDFQPQMRSLAARYDDRPRLALYVIREAGSEATA